MKPGKIFNFFGQWIDFFGEIWTEKPMGFSPWILSGVFL
jgi:hypothetical protein